MSRPYTTTSAASIFHTREATSNPKQREPNIKVKEEFIMKSGGDTISVERLKMPEKNSKSSSNK